jgi:hypothetical protein
LRPRLAAAFALPVAAAVALWLAGGRTLTRWGSAEGTFEARGSSAAPARVDAICTGGPLTACPRGSRLVFHGWAGAGQGFLSAYAEPVGGGERIWYFSAEGESPRLGPDAVDRSVVVGPEHVALRYRVHAVVGTRPLSRAEAVAANDPAVVGTETLEIGIAP